jgi:hypothetical protein
MCLPFQHSILRLDLTTLTVSTVSLVIIPVPWFFLKFIIVTIPNNTADVRVLKGKVGFVRSAGENPKQEPKQDKAEIRVDNYPAQGRKTWARD